MPLVRVRNFVLITSSIAFDLAFVIFKISTADASLVLDVLFISLISVSPLCVTCVEVLIFVFVASST